MNKETTISERDKFLSESLEKVNEIKAQLDAAQKADSSLWPEIGAQVQKIEASCRALDLGSLADFALKVAECLANTTQTNANKTVAPKAPFFEPSESIRHMLIDIASSHSQSQLSLANTNRDLLGSLDAWIPTLMKYSPRPLFDRGIVIGQGNTQLFISGKAIVELVPCTQGSTTITTSNNETIEAIAFDSCDKPQFAVVVSAGDNLRAIAFDTLVRVGPVAISEESIETPYPNCGGVYIGSSQTAGVLDISQFLKTKESAR